MIRNTNFTFLIQIYGKQDVFTLSLHFIHCSHPIICIKGTFSFFTSVLPAILLLLQTALISVNRKANSHHSGLLTLHLFQDLLHNSSCYMTEILKSDIALALTHWHMSRPPPFTFKSHCSRNITAHLGWHCGEGCPVFDVTARPLWLTPWKIHFRRSSPEIVSDSQHLLLKFIKEKNRVRAIWHHIKEWYLQTPP